jgi:probable F420-dependent oxidoreductase
VIGLNLPFPGVALRDHRELVENLIRPNFSSVWASESAALDAVTPLAAVAAWAPRLAVGTAVIPVQSRGPALIAMTGAALAELGGPTSLGIGASSPVVVSDWNDRLYDRPVERVRDTLRFLRQAFTGASVTARYDTFRVKNFRLNRPVVDPPQLLVAALRPRMLALAGSEGDGAITTMVSPSDLVRVRRHLRSGARLLVWVTVCPSEDGARVRRAVRPMVAPYLCFPAYRAQQAWLGRSEALAATWAAWDQGQVVDAVGALPDSVIDELVVHGSAEHCARRLAEYTQAGASEVICSLDPALLEPAVALAALARAIDGRALAQ